MKTFMCILALTALAMSDSNVQQILKVGNDQFTAKMFKEVVKTQSRSSCVLSAFSVLSPLAQLALGSVGPSHDEILDAIGMPNDNVTKEVFSDANTRLRSVKGVELKQANKVYVRSGYTLNDEFSGVSRDVFNSEVQNINFADQQGAADEMNAWVEDHTNKRIKNLVDPQTLTDSTAAVLVNAIYFKGSWKTPFNKFQTQDDDFFISKDKTIRIPMMHQTDEFKYGESSELDAQFLEMQYEGNETSFVVVLPNQYDGIDSLIKKFEDPEAFSKALGIMYNIEVEVSLPKFKIETTTDLKEILEKTKEVFSDANTRLRSVKGVELKQANKVYVRSGYTLNDEFSGVSRDVFNSEVQNINFADQQGAADEMNAWVEDHTNKRIKNLVDPQTLTDSTAAVLVNAIYFKGSWKTPFNKFQTQDDDFFISKDKTIRIPMMHQTDEFKYGESSELDAQFLEMQYEGNETSFVVVLPNQYDGIDSLIKKFEDPEAFSKALGIMYNIEVEVSLPKFKIETTTDLKEILEKINVTKLFNEDLARLDNLIKGEKNLFVSDAIQKAFIEVNEEGAEAAAANKFGISFATSVGSPKFHYEFNANHPFIFFLLEKNNILFNGVFRS